MSIALVTFDLDDTLWPIWPTIARADAKLHAWLKDHRADLLDLIARATSKPDLAKMDGELESSIKAFKELYLKDPARKQVKG